MFSALAWTLLTSLDFVKKPKIQKNHNQSFCSSTLDKKCWNGPGQQPRHVDVVGRKAPELGGEAVEAMDPVLTSNTARGRGFFWIGVWKKNI